MTVPTRKPKSPSDKKNRSIRVQNAFRPAWIGWAFWGLCSATLVGLVIAKERGSIIPALATALTFILTRGGVTERLRPYHPAYCIGTAMAIWLLWTLAASGATHLLIDLGLLLLGLGLVSVLPGIVSTSILSILLAGFTAVVWGQRYEVPPEERSVIRVEVILLLLTIAATWAGYFESSLRTQPRKRPRQKEATEE